MSIPNDPHGDRRPSTMGFTIIELLIVVTIIAVMSAVALPNALAYMRTAQIRGASHLVSSEIQSARAKAIKRNVNFGVVVAVLSNTQFQMIYEDVPGFFTRRTIDLAVGDPEGAGPVRTLPEGVVFDLGAGAATARGLRFNRFGAMCDPGSSVTCPALPGGFPPPPDYIGLDPLLGATLNLRQPSTGLTRWVRVAPGGRVEVQQ